MSQQQFQNFVTAVVPSWRKSQLTVLALCVRAMVLRRRCTLSALARGLPPTCRVICRLKRLARFMDNRHLDLIGGWKALAQRAAQLQPEGWLPMLLCVVAYATKHECFWTKPACGTMPPCCLRLFPIKAELCP